MLLFMDSFDYYNTLADKWSTVNGSNATVDLTGTLGRTGIGCLVMSGGAIGPTKFIPTGLSHLIMGTAFNPTTIPGGAGNGAGIMSLRDSVNNVEQVSILYGQNGAIRVFNGSSLPGQTGSVLLATSAPNLVQAGVYNTIDVECTIGPGTGFVRVFLNGQLVINATGLVTQNPGSNPYADQWALYGLSANGDRHDDVYLLDASTPPNNTVIIGPRIFATMPSGDGTPSLWTPLVAGPHFAMVNEIPDDGDTSYVFDSNIGDADMYTFAPGGQLPVLSQIEAVQVTLTARLDSGSRSIASRVAGTNGPTIALTTGYKAYSSQFDINPGTGQPWKPTDFPATQIGEIVVA